MPAKLQISLTNLKYNIDSIKEKIYDNQELLVMVKADAYGAGIVKVTSFLEKQNIKNFGVAYLNEAELLRDNGIKANIIVFSGILPGEVKKAVALDAIYSVSDVSIIQALDKQAGLNGTNVKVEIAIDTGMTRLGFSEYEVDDLIACLRQTKHIEIDGVYTHFSCADTDDDYTRMQIEAFDRIVEKLRTNGINFKHVHACNSAGILRYNNKKYSMVRLGICAYGYYPSDNMKDDISLKGIFRLVAPICNIRKIAKGKAVSYNKTYINEENIDMAVLHIGYADGLTRTLSNKLTVYINGMQAKQIGNICMDTCMIDVSNIQANEGDEAVIFDFEDDKLEKIAMETGTIIYEVITNIGKRVAREYI